MNNEFNQPVGGQFQQPVGGQPNGGTINIGGKSVNKNTAIIGAVVVVIIAIVAFIALSGSGKSAVGEWECTGTSGDATIKINKNDMEMTMTKYGSKITMSGKISKTSTNVKSDKKKSGYSYKQYKLKDAKVAMGSISSNMGDNYGFTFGVSKDGKEGHYLDGMGNSSSYNFDCKKK